MHQSPKGIRIEKTGGFDAGKETYKEGKKAAIKDKYRVAPSPPIKDDAGLTVPRTAEETASGSSVDD